MRTVLCPKDKFLSTSYLAYSARLTSGRTLGQSLFSLPYRNQTKWGSEYGVLCGVRTPSVRTMCSLQDIVRLEVVWKSAVGMVSTVVLTNGRLGLSYRGTCVSSDLPHFGLGPSQGQ